MKIDCTLLRDYRKGYYSTWLYVIERVDRRSGVRRAREKYRALFGAVPEHIVPIGKHAAKVGPITTWAGESEAVQMFGFGSDAHKAFVEFFYGEDSDGSETTA